jgi:ADP-ribose pyrophosphatase
MLVAQEGCTLDLENPETAVVEHREVYHGKIVNLHVDTVRLASGRTVVREIVRHPGGVVAIPVLDDGRLLLVRQFRYPLQKFILEFPAGKLDSNQPPLDTIMRELEEESGYRAGSVEYQFSFYTTPGISDEVIHFYLATNLIPVSQRLEEGEHITVETFSPEQCLDMIRTGEIADGKTILALLWFRLKIGVK